MPGVFKKLLHTIGISADSYEDEFEEFEVEPKPEPEFSTFSSGRKGKVVNINATTQFKVVVIQPEGFDEAKDIADHLKDRKPVVINLELLDKDTAHKIFDFLSGAIYALGGSIQKIAVHIYLIAPYNVTILGDFKDELTNKGFFWNT